MALNSDNMATEILNSLATLTTEEEKRDTTKVWKKITEAIVKHIKDNLEIKGVKIALDTSLIAQTIETYIFGVGNNGGSLVTSGGQTVNGQVKTFYQTVGTQNNDGTGRVS